MFEYVSVEEAERGAAKVALDGSSVGMSLAKSVGPPHFYIRGPLIVLYVGDDTAMKSLLEKVVGPQFAGAGAGASVSPRPEFPGRTR